jgi:hypothetical protein
MLSTASRSCIVAMTLWCALGTESAWKLLHAALRATKFEVSVAD